MFPRAKKSFGQNFLADKSVVKKIIDAAEIVKGESVLEIGPGTGVLTKALVEAGADVTAIEADDDLIDGLQDSFGDSIHLYRADALSYPLGDLVQDGEYKLVANIPYNITSDLLKKFLSTSPKPSRMVIMVQREVADRIVAKPSKMSLLSVVCQVYADCKKVTNVPAGAFRPMPKVDSAVVRLDLKECVDCEKVIKIAKAGFSSRRKQLHKNLSSAGFGGSDVIKELLEKLGLDPKIRAENLSIDRWIELSKKL